MPVDAKLGPPGQDSDQDIGLTIQEFHGRATRPAHDVVTMPFGRPRVMPMAVVHVNMFDEVESGQEAHGAVDAGQADPVVDPAGAAVDLGDLEMLGGSRQDLQHRQAGAGKLQPLGLKRAGQACAKHGRFPI
jgi:hypothetical protein